MVKRKCFGFTLWFFLHVMLIGSTRAALWSGASASGTTKHSKKQRRRRSTKRKASSGADESTQLKRARKRSLTAISDVSEESDLSAAGSAKRKRLDSSQAKTTYPLEETPVGHVVHHDDKDNCVVEFRTSSDLDYFQRMARETKLLGFVDRSTWKTKILLTVKEVKGDKEYAEKLSEFTYGFQEPAEKCNLVEGIFPVESRMSNDEFVMSFGVGPGRDVPLCEGVSQASVANVNSCEVLFHINTHAVDYWKRMVADGRITGGIEPNGKMMQLILDGDTSERKVFECSYEKYEDSCQFVGGSYYLPIISYSVWGYPRITFFVGHGLPLNTAEQHRELVQKERIRELELQDRGAK